MALEVYIQSPTNGAELPAGKVDVEFVVAGAGSGNFGGYPYVALDDGYKYYEIESIPETGVGRGKFSGLGLPAGVHTITVGVTDEKGGNVLTSSSITVLVGDLPIIIIDEPVQGKTYYDTSIKVSFRVYGSTSGNPAVSFDGSYPVSITSAEPLDPGMRYTYTRETNVGAHYVLCLSADGSKTARVDFTVDDNPITLTVQHPTHRQIYGTQTVQVDFTATSTKTSISSTAALVSLDLKKPVTPSAIAIADGYKFTHYFQGVSEGNHTVTVTAADTEKNTKSSADIPIVADLTEPTISFTAPEGDAYLIISPEEDLDVQFRVSDSLSGVSESSVKVSVDGGLQTAPTQALGGGAFKHTLTAPSQGSHSVTVYADDNAGHTAAARLSFFIRYDMEGLIRIAFEYFKNYDVLSSGGAGLVFTATSDYTDLTDKSARVFVDDVEQVGIGIVAESIQNGYRYHAPLSMDEGTHVIRVEVSDDYGNSEEASITLRVSLTGPTINLESPQNMGTLTISPHSDVSIRFTAIDPVAGVAVTSVQVVVDKEDPVVPDNLHGGRWEHLQPFLEGLHKVTIYAENEAGHETVRTYQFYVTYRLDEDLYPYTDSTETVENFWLPPEALNINGVWIETRVPGYTTLNVRGREALASEVDSLQVGQADGNYFQSRRYLPRTIVVTYQLIAADDRAFRDAYNKLNEILDVEEARLIFRDEPDKFYVGTKTANNEVEPGRNAVIGELEFFCSDPFKYSVEEISHQPGLEGGKFSINYGGTRPAYPALHFRFYGSAGYVAVTKDNGANLRFGSVDESDKEYVESEELIAEEAGGDVSGWVTNRMTTVGDFTYTQTGSFESTLRHDVACLEPRDYGSGEQWHGPSYTKQVPADSSGHAGAKNCLFGWTHFFVAGSADDNGIAQFVMTAEGKRNVAALTFYKTSVGSMAAHCKLTVNGKTVRDIDYIMNEKQSMTSWQNGWSYMEKFGDTITFKIGNAVCESYRDEAIKDLEVKEVGFFLGGYKTHPVVANNGVRRVRFTKHHVDSWVDVPNKFYGKAELDVDCNAGTITLDGVEEPGLGDAANDWENFCLTPGHNEFELTQSEWASRPQVTVTYREVYL